MDRADKTNRRQIDQHLRTITTWAVLLEAIDRTQGDDVVIPNHALGEVGHSIIHEITVLQELLDELEM